MININSVDITKLDLTLSDMIKAVHQCPVKDTTQEYRFLKSILGEDGALAYYYGDEEAINKVKLNLYQKLKTMSVLERQSCNREALVANYLKQISSNGIPINRSLLQRFCMTAEKEYQEAYLVLEKKCKDVGIKLTPDFVSSQSKFKGDAEALNAELAVVRKLLKHTLLLNFDKLCNAIRTDAAGDARIYCTFESFAAVSGRIQSHNVNVQGLSKNVREECFAPSKGKALIMSDYVSEELVLMAVLAHDNHLLNDIKNGVDFHSRVAAKLFRKSITDITDLERKVAKRLTFACLYGSGEDGLKNTAAEMLGTTSKLAVGDIKSSIKSEYPAILTIEKQIKAGNGLTLIDGSVIPLEAVEKKHTVVNRCIQGSASLLLKQVIIDLIDRLPAEAKIVCLIHDEVIVECPTEIIQETKVVIDDVMRHVLGNFNINTELPIDMEVRTGE